MHSWHALLNVANKPCAICSSQGAHMGQHMNGVKAGATIIFLDIMANGSNIRHALGFGALCKLQGLLQALGVGIMAGHGCHNLNLCLFLSNPMGGIQSCLDQLWQTHGHPSVHMVLNGFWFPWLPQQACRFRLPLWEMAASSSLEVVQPWSTAWAQSAL